MAIGVDPRLEPRAVLGPVGTTLSAMDGREDRKSAVLVDSRGIVLGGHGGHGITVNVRVGAKTAVARVVVAAMAIVGRVVEAARVGEGDGGGEGGEIVGSGADGGRDGSDGEWRSGDGGGW